MSNRNYIKGRTYEYKLCAELRKAGYAVMRASGSHGAFDLVGVKHGAPVELIQAKVTAKEGVGRKLIEDFKSNPPIIPDRFYHQTMRVYVTSTRETLEVTV